MFLGWLALPACRDYIRSAEGLDFSGGFPRQPRARLRNKNAFRKTHTRSPLFELLTSLTDCARFNSTFRYVAGDISIFMTAQAYIRPNLGSRILDLEYDEKTPSICSAQ